jgi:hypothetical protein
MQLASDFSCRHTAWLIAHEHPKALKASLLGECAERQDRTRIIHISRIVDNSCLYSLCIGPVVRFGSKADFPFSQDFGAAGVFNPRMFWDAKVRSCD